MNTFIYIYISTTRSVQTRPIAENPTVSPHESCNSNTYASPQNWKKQVSKIVSNCPEWMKTKLLSRIVLSYNNEAILDQKIKQKLTHLASGTWPWKTTRSRPNIKLVERTAERASMNLRSKTAKLYIDAEDVHRAVKYILYTLTAIASRPLVRDGGIISRPTETI